MSSNLIPDQDFVKMASRIPNTEVVDAILKLGFLDKNTMSFFVENIDYFKHVESLLAQLLIYARLGQEGLDEGSIEAAMKSLNETIEHIESAESERGIVEETRSRSRSCSVRRRLLLVISVIAMSWPAKSTATYTIQRLLKRGAKAHSRIMKSTRIRSYSTILLWSRKP